MDRRVVHTDKPDTELCDSALVQWAIKTGRYDTGEASHITAKLSCAQGVQRLEHQLERRVMRETSPEFTPEYERQQHYKRLRAMRPAPKRKPRAAKQKKLQLRSIKRIEVIQMAELSRYHYEVWADFDDGDSELLQRDYVHGLKNAVRMAIEKWGRHRIELCRWHPKKHRPLLVISDGA